jgi:arylsulfatase A-like enzyme
MGDSQFDTWTRRQFGFGLATGGTLATLLGLLGRDEAAAKTKHGQKRKRRKKRQRRQRRREQNQTAQTPSVTPGPSPSNLPDIVLITVDDMRESDYLALPQTRALLRDQGTAYPNYFATTPLCGPSRASVLRGQYAHNTGILRNGGSEGGWDTFHDSGADQHTIATWLRGAQPAYRTAFVGKYLNGYNSRQNQIAPGWSDWYVPVPVSFYNYTLNVNGVPEAYGNEDADYLTDVLAEKARAVITSTPVNTPLFLYFAPKSPHGPATPARRHIGAFANQPLDQSGSFNEEDMSDKPQYMQRPLLSEEEIDELAQTNRNRLESLLAVDEAVASIVATLEQTGRLGRAYIVFVTDNGFLLGQHRRTAKQVPYEEAIRMSLLVRGPNVPSGRVNDALVANIDLGPTFAAFAGVATAGFVDGRSFAETFRGGTSARQALLIEGYGKEEQDPEEVETLLAAANARTTPEYHAIRTADWLYVEYENAAQERELYDLNADPFELQSRHADPIYAETVQALSAWLATLEDCDAAGCRDAENSPPG